MSVQKSKIVAAQGIRQGGMAGTWGSISIMLMTDEQVEAFVASIPTQGEGGFNTEYYDYYRCYSTDALCSECAGDDFTIWLDLSNLRKSDLNTCAYKANGHDDEYYLTPNKITEIDLEGYKPYIALDFSMYHEIQSPDGSWENYDQEKAAAEAYFGTALNNVQIQVPISKTNPNIGSRYVFMFPMETAAAYPSESAF